MYLVVGLAIAVLAGIVAAYYFSVRSGKRGGKQPRSTGSGRVGGSRAGAAGPPAGRIGRPPRTGPTEFALRASGPARAAGGIRPAAGRPGALTESWPAAPSDFEDTEAGVDASRPGADDRPGPGDPRQRRRVGFRKGADIDEELWPAESFGGVSDEQFWDDMASDKPLTTTARTAQPEAGPRSSLLDTGFDTDPQGTQALGRTDPSPNGRNRADQNRADQNRADRNRADRNRGGQDAAAGRRGPGYGAYPGPRTGADPAAGRAAASSAYAATQAVKNMTGPGSPSGQSARPAERALPAGRTLPAERTAPAQSTPPAGATQPARAAAGPGPSGPATPPRGISGQPGEGQNASRGGHRRRSSAEEDPLTSSSFSLRQRGPVDGRSSLRSRDADDAASGSSRGPASPYRHAAPHAPAGTSYDNSSSATQMMSTPPFGENYGYDRGGQADQPSRPNGTRRHARPDGPGEQARPARPAYPPDARPANGGNYPSGVYPGNGYNGPGYQPGAHPVNGHQGNGHQGTGQGNGNGSRSNSHRAPYDPRDDYRRLTHQR